VARWSTRKSSASCSESVARRSIASSRPSWRQEGLAATGQAQEDVADAAAQFGLLDGDPDGRLLDLVECLTHLTDLVATEVERRRLVLDVDPLTVLQPLHHPGQTVGGEVAGGVAQPLQLPDQSSSGRD
jgi:hypothetical protein